MKETKKMDLTLLAFVIFAIVLGFWMADANATKYTPPKPDQDQAQDQHQVQGQNQDQSQTLTNDNRNTVGATANNHGNNTAIQSKTEVYAAGASSGDSSSTCQKVRDTDWPAALPRD